MSITIIKMDKSQAFKAFNLLVKEFLELANTWRSYRQNGWSCHSPYTFVPKDAELTR